MKTEQNRFALISQVSKHQLLDRDEIETEMVKLLGKKL